MVQYSLGGGGYSIVIVYTTLGIVSTILFALRIYVRVNLVKRSWEDWAAGIGWLFFVLVCCVAVVGSYHGIGQHMVLIPPTIRSTGLKFFWAAESLYTISNMALKMSIALMLLRVVVEEHHKKIIYIVTGVMEAYSLIYIVGFIVQCIPTSFFWTRFDGNKEGHCMDPKITVAATYVHSLISMVYDFTMALLPWLIVRKTQMELRTRLMVAVILALASITSIATIVRIPYIAALAHTEDLLHSVTGISIWSGVELGMASIASSAATLRPLFRKSSARSVRNTTLKSATKPSNLNTSSSSALKSQQHGVRVLQQDLELSYRNER